MSVQTLSYTNYQPNTSKGTPIPLRDQLYNKIISALRYLGKDESDRDIFAVEWDWQGAKEQYCLSRRDIMFLVEDILYEHPRCWDYRKAVIALIKSEGGIVDPITRIYRGNKKWYINADTYRSVREKILDLSTPPSKDIFNELIKLGPNPTQGLGSSLEESKFASSILINKCWRTKKDFVAKVTVEDVQKKMISDILSNPISAMKNNAYVYSALKEHSGYWN